MYCDWCGCKISEDSKFCYQCGACVNDIIPKNEGSVERVNSKMSGNGFSRYCTILIGILGCVVLLFAVFRTTINILSSEQLPQQKNEKKIFTEKTFVPKTASKPHAENRMTYHKYENSTFKIGNTMPAGEYVLFASSSSSGGYFCLSSDSSGDSIIANDNFEYNSIITVNNGEYLELKRCYAEPINSAPTVYTTGEGMFKIGTHLSAGEYKLIADDLSGGSGYFCVYNDGRHDDIANNDNFEGTAYVTVKNGQYLELTRCYIAD